MKRSLLLSLAIILAAGCGAGAAEPTASDVAALQQLTTGVQTAAEGHASTMMSASMASTTGCAATRDNYVAGVRSSVTQMMEVAGSMDGFMMEHVGRASADIRCAAAAMMRDLDQHQSAECASGDAAADQAETTRHAAAMNAATSHMLDRCREMLAAMRGESFSPSPMMAGCAESTAASGCCGMMSGGGMMGR